MAWEKDYTVTSDGLPGYLQRQRGVHILFIEFGKPYEKMSLLSIDMNAKCLEYFHLYMDGSELFKSGGNNDFITAKCLSPTSRPFLPCEFPRLCRLSRYVCNISCCMLALF
jgi:hypothetical protein